jgi:hypothetical protein
MTKTEQRLLAEIEKASRSGSTSIAVRGIREYNAARQLVKAGLVKEFRDCTARGEQYFYRDPFTRGWYSKRRPIVYGGSLHFGGAA